MTPDPAHRVRTLSPAETAARVPELADVLMPDGAPSATTYFHKQLAPNVAQS